MQNHLWFSSVALNLNLGSTSRGSLSQGPSLTSLGYVGGTLGVGIGLDRRFNLTVEGNVTYNQGSPDAGGPTPQQGASSVSVRAGLVGTYSWAENSHSATSIGIGLWYQGEFGNVAGAATSDSPNGAFQTNSIIVGVSFGGRQER